MQNPLLCTNVFHILTFIGCRSQANVPRLLHLLLWWIQPEPTARAFFRALRVFCGLLCPERTAYPAHGRMLDVRRKDAVKRLDRTRERPGSHQRTLGFDFISKIPL